MTIGRQMSSLERGNNEKQKLNHQKKQAQL